MSMNKLQDKDKLIEILEKKLIDKEAELNELYDLLGRLNSYVDNLVEDTETGIRAAMALHRKFASRKLPNVSDMTFASKYVVSTSDSSSYYDLFELPSEAGVGLVLTDTSGYGLSALVMSIVVSLLETPLAKSPNAFMTTLVTDLKEHLLKDDGKNIKHKDKDVSVLMMAIERSELLLRYCCIGMPAIIIVREEERFSLEVDDGSIMEDLEIKERTFKLAPGDRIIVPNNGLYYAQNAKKEVFAEDGLIRSLHNAQHLPVGDMVANIGFELDSFVEGKRSRLNGDLALVGIELERRMLYVV